MSPKIPSSPSTFHAPPSAAYVNSSIPVNAEKMSSQDESSTAASSRTSHKRKYSPSPLQEEWKRHKTEESRIKLTQNTEAELNLHKQVDAPVEELTQKKALLMIKELGADIK
ncbi:MAG TPA: hypothetical protein VIG66_06840, partial [Noviherbaspirillum sp.]